MNDAMRAKQVQPAEVPAGREAGQLVPPAPDTPGEETLESLVTSDDGRLSVQTSDWHHRIPSSDARAIRRITTEARGLTAKANRTDLAGDGPGTTIRCRLLRNTRLCLGLHDSSETMTIDRAPITTAVSRDVRRRPDHGLPPPWPTHRSAGGSRRESIRQAIYHEGYSQSEFTAYKAHQFAKVVARDQELDRYRKAAQRGELSWTHIQALIQVKNATERRHYFNASTRGHWSPGSPEAGNHAPAGVPL